MLLIINELLYWVKVTGKLYKENEIFIEKMKKGIISKNNWGGKKKER
ncbi:MAG: hypothetical protein LE169_04710 [Endomicrobium sp.]|nr:hypothetical protein [Endomicrobium sp.]